MINIWCYFVDITIRLAMIAMLLDFKQCIWFGTGIFLSSDIGLVLLAIGLVLG